MRTDEAVRARLATASEIQLKLLGGGRSALFIRDVAGALNEVPVSKEIALTLVFAAAISFSPSDPDEAMRHVGNVHSALSAADSDGWLDACFAVARQLRLSANGGSFGFPDRIPGLLSSYGQTFGEDWLVEAARLVFDTPDTPITRVAVHRDQVMGESFTIYFRRSPLVDLRNALGWLIHQRVRALREAGLEVVQPQPGDLEKVSRMIAEVFYAVLMDGYPLFIVGKTGSGKTTLQNAILLEIGGRFNGPIVVTEAYPELEPYLHRISHQLVGLRCGYYYCIYSAGVNVGEEMNPLNDLMRVITSGNVSLLVIQEANLSISAVFQKLFGYIITSGVPTLTTAFSMVPKYILENSEYTVGKMIADDLSTRLFGKPGRLGRSAILAIPALQLYLPDTSGAIHPVFSYSTGNEGSVHALPHLRPVPESVAPRGSRLGSLIQIALSKR